MPPNQYLTSSSMTQIPSGKGVSDLHRVIDLKRSKGYNTIHPHDFLSRWVERIWGIFPDEKRRYRRACMAELRLHVPPDVTDETMRRWKWDEEDDFYPDYLPVILCYVDEHYQEREILRTLPRRSLD